MYRVEINPIASVLGFRGTLSGIAVEVGGHEDRHWDEVLQVLNGSTIEAVRFLRRRETPVPPDVLQQKEAALPVGCQDAGVRRWEGLDVPGARCLSVALPLCAVPEDIPQSLLSQLNRV